MARSILGVDIGCDNLKLALVKGGVVKKAVAVAMPKNLVREGRVISPEAMGELIRRAMKEYGIRCQEAAFVLSNETVIVRNVMMPKMTAEQLTYNLPYEFSDYVTEELKDYVFDYAVLGEGDTSDAMELFAVGAPVSLVEEARQIVRKAGLKLVKAAPAVCSYISLIRARGGDPDREYCILDLGYQAIRMYMFRGDRHIVTRVLEIGLSSLDDVIAETQRVDVHLAHTYLLSNYEGCQSGEACLNAYGNIAIELMRALNFYRFSNPDSDLADIYVCGGGAVIAPLQAAIEDALDLTIHQAEELLPNGGIDDGYTFIQAVGAALDT